MIALTAGALDHDRQQSQAAGMNAYVTKPVNLEKLLQLIASLLPSAAKPAAPEHDQSPPPHRHPYPAKCAPLPELPGINVTGRSGLRVRNKVDFYRRMLLKFRDIHAGEMAHELQQNIPERLRPEATRSAHSLKGVALSLGIDRLGELAAECRDAPQGTGQADQRRPDRPAPRRTGARSPGAQSARLAGG